MFESWFFILGLYAILGVAVVLVYGRQGRWYGAAGWMLALGGQVFLALGGGDLFAWGGLTGLFITGVGVLLVIYDSAMAYRSRR